LVCCECGYGGLRSGVSDRPSVDEVRLRRILTVFNVKVDVETAVKNGAAI